MSRFPPGSYSGHRSNTPWDDAEQIAANCVSNANQYVANFISNLTSFPNNQRPVQGHSNYMTNPPFFPQTASFASATGSGTAIAIGSGSGTAIATASSDDSRWEETPEAHVLRVELPGMTGEDVKVAVMQDRRGRAVNITGVRNIEKRLNINGELRVQRSSQNFSHSVSMPDTAVADGWNAYFEDGVLTVTLLKRRMIRASR